MPRSKPPLPSSGPTYALAYARVSTSEQAREGVSLDAQVAACRAYIGRQGWVIAHEYLDVLSGMNDARPQYVALLAHAQELRTEGRAVAVVVMRLDRLGRRVLERVRARESLKAIGVQTHSVMEGGPVSDLVSNILASVAEEESRQTSERIAFAKRHIVAGGWHPGGRLPWGYTYRDATALERAAGAPRRLPALDPVTSPYAAEVFSRLVAGASLRSLTAWLHRQPAAARGGQAVTHAVLAQLVRSRCYIAQAPDGTPGRWPACVPEATWLAAQAVLDSHSVRPRQASGRYLLTGLLRCPRCGQRMAGGGLCRQRYPRYRCGGIRYGGCVTAVHATQFDRAVLAAVDRRVRRFLRLTQGPLRPVLAVAWELQRQPPVPAEAPRLLARQRTIAQAQDRLRRAALLYADGAIDQAGYETIRDTATADLAAATAEAGNVAPRRSAPTLPPLDVVLAQVGDWERARASADLALLRPLLALLIESLTFTRRGTRWEPVQPVIRWTPLGVLLGRRMGETR